LRNSDGVNPYWGVEYRPIVLCHPAFTERDVFVRRQSREVVRGIQSVSRRY